MLIVYLLLLFLRKFTLIGNNVIFNFTKTKNEDNTTKVRANKNIKILTFKQLEKNRRLLISWE